MSDGMAAYWRGRRAEEREKQIKFALFAVLRKLLDS